MAKYELTIKLAQIQRLVEERKYKKAAALMETIDIRQVRTQADLHTFAEVYVRTEQFAAAKAIYLRLYKKKRTKRILYRLLYLAIRTNELEEAEDFYQEFLGLSKSDRDNLILRYRIDKAKGVPISQLIETLEQLKDEEYVEEWAYELAKLYQRAGRDEDCRRECEDIILWFGEGEIVERADMLLDYLDGDPQLFYEDKDYTIKPEEINPDDTGSLPEIDEDLIEQERKKTRRKRKAEADSQIDEETEDEETTERKTKGGFFGIPALLKRGNKNTEKKESKEEEPKTSDSVQTDEAAVQESADGQNEDGQSPVMQDTDAQGTSVQNIDEQSAQMAATQGAAALEQDLRETVGQVIEEEKSNPQPEEEKHSQSGMGITQDLAKEIAAIFEAEKREQLKEKAVAVMSEVPEMVGEVPNIAVSVVDRMAHAVQSKTGRLYIPLDVLEQSDEMAASVQKPDGMEEIVAGGTEEEVTMIELDQIMPEPDIPELKQVIPQDSPELGNQPALEEKDLPTTKALHHSFDDMLTLIAGEREPKHFVLIGTGEERILGITKKIVRVMHQKKFMSTCQIARIHSEKLNEMDLLKVCGQIRGNCLLIDDAASLTFPTITKIFAVMDAFHGDFTVVLADEGNTLDELFKVAPALARRFEYVIDITQYDEEDYI